MRIAMSLTVRPALGIILALAGAFCVAESRAAVVGRAISADGDLNLTTFNPDADGDTFPNVDNDFDGINESITVESDMFGLARRGQYTVAGTQNPHSTGDPGEDPYAFAIQDDSASVFTGDAQGIIKGGSAGAITDSDPFFAVVDTVNIDTGQPVGESTPQMATWLFDVSGASGGLSVSIDMAAMGDFESGEDLFDFEYALDGGSFSPLFTSSVDDQASQIYTLENEMEFEVDDPVLMDGVMLNNEFQTFSAGVGTATSSLTVRFTALSDGGTEAFAFRNILVEDGFVPGGLDGDYNDDGTVDAADYVIWRANEGTSNMLPNDPDGGVIGEDQYDTWIENFGETVNGSGGGSSGAGVVPEPATAALLLIGIAMLCGRRRAA
jgi:PEP-CTERM motif